MDFYLGFFFYLESQCWESWCIKQQVHILFLHTHSHTSLRWESSKYYYAVNVDFGQQKSRILVCIVLLFFRKTDDPQPHEKSFQLPAYLFVHFDTRKRLQKCIQVAKASIVDILFLSNHNIHKSFCGLCFQASDPLIEIFQ